MQKVYKVEGMSCGGCSSSVEQAIKAVAPEASVEIQLEGGLVTVEGADNDALIEQAVEDAGFTYAGLA
ncbi:MAG: heavy-metal-associated domain-containing protein [Chromatiales bacterium]|nr:heavy-metal-associated domain-containing protein [Chromatiales bacterium]